MNTHTHKKHTHTHMNTLTHTNAHTHLNTHTLEHTHTRICRNSCEVARIPSRKPVGVEHGSVMSDAHKNCTLL